MGSVRPVVFSAASVSVNDASVKTLLPLETEPIGPGIVLDLGDAVQWRTAKQYCQLGEGESMGNEFYFAHKKKNHGARGMICPRENLFPSLKLSLTALLSIS
jgi:hypothetical protein